MFVTYDKHITIDKIISTNRNKAPTVYKHTYTKELAKGNIRTKLQHNRISDLLPCIISKVSTTPLSICRLFDITKDAHYKYMNNIDEHAAKLTTIVEYIKEQVVIDENEYGVVRISNRARCIRNCAKVAKAKEQELKELGKEASIEELTEIALDEMYKGSNQEEKELLAKTKNITKDRNAISTFLKSYEHLQNFYFDEKKVRHILRTRHGIFAPTTYSYKNNFSKGKPVRACASPNHLNDDYKSLLINQSYSMDYYSEKLKGGREVHGLLVIDNANGYILANDAYTTQDSENTKKTLEKVFATFSIPKFIHSDQGLPFTSKVTKDLIRINGSEPSNSSAGCPYQNGKNESMVGKVKAQLKKLGLRRYSFANCQQVFDTVKAILNISAPNYNGSLSRAAHREKCIQEGKYYRPDINLDASSSLFI